MIPNNNNNNNNNMLKKIRVDLDAKIAKQTLAPGYFPTLIMVPSVHVYRALLSDPDHRSCVSLRHFLPNWQGANYDYVNNTQCQYGKWDKKFCNDPLFYSRVIIAELCIIAMAAKSGGLYNAKQSAILQVVKTEQDSFLKALQLS